MKHEYLAKKAEVTVNLEGLEPIHSPEAEKSVLGAMLSDPEAVIDEVAGVLRADDFFNPAHQSLFKCLIDMRNRALPIDPSTVLQYLEDRKIADSVGGPALLGQMAAGVVSVLTCPAHTQTVREKSLLNRLQKQSGKIAFNCQQRQHEPALVLEEAEREIYKIGESSITGEPKLFASYCRPVLEKIMINRARGTEYDGMPYGFRLLDQATCGAHKGELIIVAARPGVGKSAFALTLAKNFLKHKIQDDGSFTTPGYGVGLFSLEMTYEQMMLRWLAQATGLDSKNIRNGQRIDENGDKTQMSDRELTLIELAMLDLKEMPFYFDDSPSLTISQLRSKARRLKKKHSIDVIIVDYLQLMGGQGEESRQVEVSNISKGLKGLAKELNIPIIVLAQLNRKTDDSASGEPQLHHLRESGSIEQDADTVILLSRQERGTLLDIAKVRDGSIERILMRFIAHRTEFEEQGLYDEQIKNNKKSSDWTGRSD